MIRVLHVLNAIEVGGCEHMALQLIRHHDRSRFTPAVCELQREDNFLRDEFMALPDVPLLYCPWRGLADSGFVARFAGLCRGMGIDAVLGYSLPTYAWIALGALLAGVRRRALHVGNVMPFDGRFPIKYRVYGRLVRWLCSDYVAVSGVVADSLVDTYGTASRRVHLVPNSCDARAIAGRAQRVRESSDGAPLRITMVARLEQQKDHATLVEAFGLVRREFPDAVLCLVGDGPLRSDIEDHVHALGLAGSVELPGFRRDVPEILGASSIFVLSTHTEGLPLVVPEAFAAGLPVVGSDVPPVREVLEDGVMGVLVPPRDPEALAGALCDLARSPARRAALGEAGRRRAMEKYDIRVVTRAYERVLSGE